VKLSDKILAQSGLIVEAVYVLGDHPGEPSGVSKAFDGMVTRVGQHIRTGSPQLTVEVHPPAPLPKLGADSETVDVEVLGVDFGPQPVRSPEIGNPGFGGDTGAGEHQDPLCRFENFDCEPEVDHGVIIGVPAG